MSFVDRAAALRNRGINALAGMSENLSSLRSLLSELSTQFSSLVDITSAADSGFDDLKVTEALVQICTLLDRRSDEGAQTVIFSHFSNASAALESLDKQAKTFRLMASLTAIQVAEAEAVEILDFVQDLRQVPNRIQVSVVEVRTALKGLTSGQKDAQTKTFAAAGILREARIRFAAATEPVTQMLPKVQAARDRIQKGASTFAVETHREMLNLITAFQFSDFIAQRLEHVVDMLTMTSDESAGIEAVAKAQLSALALDGNDVIFGLQAGLGRLGRLTHKAQQIFNDDGSVTRQLFTAQRTALALLQAARKIARPAIDSATATALQMSLHMKLVDDSLVALLETSKIIDLAAINARLKTSRTRVSQAAFAFLSTSVMETALTSRRQIEDCKIAVTEISKSQADELSRLMVTTANTLESRMTDCGTSLGQTESADAALNVARMAVSQSVGQLVDALTLCAPFVRQLSKVMSDISALSKEMQSSEAAVLAGIPLLDQVYDSYTISREREVHDTIIGRERTEACHAKTIELDDIFF